MKLILPTHLDAYTVGTRELEVKGNTVGDGLAALEKRFPGIRFRLVDEQGRIREHISIFVRGEKAKALSVHVGPSDEMQIVAALSGG